MPNNALALSIRSPEVDLAGPLQAAAAIQRAQTQNSLADLQLRQSNQQYGALQAFNQNKDIGELAMFPDIQQKVVGAQSAMRGDAAEQMARAAQRVQIAGPEGSQEREAAKQAELAGLAKVGHIAPLAYQSMVSKPATDDVLKGIITQGMPLAAAEAPKFGEVGEDVDKYANKRKVFGFIDPIRQTVSVRPLAPSSGGNAFGGPPTTELTGQALLDTLDPGDREQVKAILDGRQQPPSANARNPRTQKIMEWVAQADPSFDMTTWKARNQLRSEFASSKSGAGGNIQALETAMYHMDRLDKATKALNNSDIPLGSVAREFIGNPIARNMSGLSDYDARAGTFELAKKAVLDEATKVFVGSSGGVFDRESWESKLQAADSPTKQKAVLKELVGLMKGRVESLATTWNRTMGGAERNAYDLISPETGAKVKKMLGEATKENAGQVPKTTPEQQGAILDEARKAIAGGKKRSAVIERLTAMGVDPAGL